jgi:hypothetical protein
MKPFLRFFVLGLAIAVAVVALVARRRCDGRDVTPSELDDVREPDRVAA